MKRLFIAIVMSAFILTAHAQGVQFTDRTDWNQVKEQAKKENKFIFVDFYATWCGPCKAMDKEVYSNSGVGSYLNDNFISVKVQMDKTNTDNAYVKSWYHDKEQMQEKYKISGLPTFLFFNSDGEMVHQGSGFMKADEFQALCKTAADPAKSFAGQLEQFKKGILKGEALLTLAQEANKFKQDSIALIIARKYKTTVLDKQNPVDLLVPKVLPMFGEFAKTYTINDKLVQYMYKHKDQADKGFAQPGIAGRIVDFLITRDIINPIIFDNGKPVATTPDWKKIENKLAKQFDAKTAFRNTLVSKADWYYAKKDWDEFIKAWIVKIDTLGIDMKSMYDGLEINNTVFEIIFEHSNDPYAIKKGIEYMEALVKVDPNSAARMDTYAAILYKSGQKDKAIEIEKKAVVNAEKEKNEDYIKEFNETITKMQNGQPTWVTPEDSTDKK